MKGLKFHASMSALLIVAGFGLFASSADSAVLPGSAGRQYDNEGCWSVYYSDVVNNCGSGTTNTQKWLVPVAISVFGTYNVRAKVYGQFLQTGAWASCAAVSFDGGLYTVSSRGTTSTSTAGDQELNLGTVFTGWFTGGSYTATYFDCDVTFGGRIDSVNYWQ